MAKIQWPKGKTIEAFKNQVAEHAETILASSMLVIDPSSSGKTRGNKPQSYPGFARYESGILKDSGIIKLDPSKPVQYRLEALQKELTTRFTSPGVLIIERLRGRMVPWPLWWAAGVSVASCAAPVLLECPILMWKAVAEDDPKYVKGDLEDALAIGETVLILAREAVRKK